MENIRKKIRKLRREVKERIDKDNRLKDKMTQDCCLLLLPSKRLESY